MRTSSQLSIPEVTPDDEPSPSSPIGYRTPAKKAFFDFLRLPVEIRLKVYGVVFADYVGERSTDKRDLTEISLRSATPSPVTPAGFDLTMINKKLHGESLPVLYHIHVFRLSSCGGLVDCQRELRPNYPTERLLAQLMRPSAPALLSMMTQLYLSLTVWCDPVPQLEKIASVLGQISTNCTTLKAFCLQMELIPEQWACANDSLTPELRACIKPGEDALRSLCDLASRVREFEIHAGLDHEDEVQYEDFWKQVVPGQTRARTEGEYEIRWTSDLPGKMRSLVFHKHALELFWL